MCAAGTRDRATRTRVPQRSRQISLSSSRASHGSGSYNFILAPRARWSAALPPPSTSSARIQCIHPPASAAIQPEELSLRATNSAIDQQRARLLARAALKSAAAAQPMCRREVRFPSYARSVIPPAIPSRTTQNSSAITFRTRPKKSSRACLLSWLWETEQTARGRVCVRDASVYVTDAFGPAPSRGGQ